MTVEGWFAVLVVAGMVVTLASNRYPADLVLVAALGVFVVSGVLTPEEALQGFATPALGTVAALLVVAAGVRATGGLDALARLLLGRPRGVAGAQLRLMLPVAGVSAFLNNTPVVALMVPAVLDWCRRMGLPSSRLLIPLSYASILGGVCTLVGTSTNLVVVGMAERLPEAPRFGLFDVAVLGVPALLAGVTYVVLCSRWLLPDRRAPTIDLDHARAYTVAMRVGPGPDVAGRTIAEAGLRHLPGLYLTEIVRGPDVLAAPGPDVRLQEDDVLRFAGVVESVRDLRNHPGLVPAEEQVGKVGGASRRRMYEAVVAPAAPMVGQNVRDFGFRTRFGAAILAVHRRGERVPTKIGDIVLRPGDALLLEAPAGFFQRYRSDPDFALVVEVEGSQPPLQDRAWLALVVLVGMVVANATGRVPLFPAALGAAGLLVAFGCIRGRDARQSLDLPLLLTIGAAFGVGAALDVSGAARVLAEGLVTAASGLGGIGVLAAIYVCTACLTELITNNGAAALMLPIAAAAAGRTGVDLHTTALVVMIAASASFATPIGYQTNLMVLGPGGYRWGDFLRFGFPLQIVVGVTTLAVTAAVLL